MLRSTGLLKTRDGWFTVYAVAIAVKASNSILIQITMIFVGLILIAIFPAYIYNLYLYPYFVAGYYTCKAKSGINQKIYNSKSEKDLFNIRIKWNIVGGISIVLFIILLTKFEKRHYIYTSGMLGGNTNTESLRLDGLRWLIGITGSIAILWVGKYVFNIIAQTKVCSFIEHMGKESLAIYALSVSLVSFWLPKIASKVLLLMPDFNLNSCILVYNVIITPSIALLYAVIILLIIKVFRKTQIYVLLFGK